MIHQESPATFLESDTRPWDDRMAGLMADQTRIVALRGADSVNGIDPVAAAEIVQNLADNIGASARAGIPVALLYDGDADNRRYPDVGSVFGSVADALRDEPNVVALAAPTRSWYAPHTEGGPLTSAGQTPYETYVFADSLPGAHDSLTQSEALVANPLYEQIIIGAVGKIALGQLDDLSKKAHNRPLEIGPVPVTVIELPINAELDDTYQLQLETAPSELVAEHIQGKLDQRFSRPYGALFDMDGAFDVDISAYPGIAFEVAHIDNA